jgi:hypothetical protein
MILYDCINMANNHNNHKNQINHTKIIVQTNMESISALLIRQGLPQGEWLVQLNSTAIKSNALAAAKKTIYRKDWTNNK